MKSNFLKSTLKFMVMAIMATTLFASCNNDDDPTEDPVIVLDGLYVKVDGATDADLVSKVKLTTTKNEVLQEQRSSLYEIYIALEAGSNGFNLVQVAGSDMKTFGPAADFALVAEADLDVEEPKKGLWKGGYEETTSMFTVPEDGLYHVVVDTELGKAAIARVVWGAIGAATPGGWGGSTEMPAVAFDLNTMTFAIDEVTLTASDWKFRYSDGWKIVLDTELDLGDGKTGVKVNCNFGGALDALEAGGDNFTNDTYAVYKVEMVWTLGEGHEAMVTYVKDGEPLATFPEAMYLVGDATAYGWDAPGGNAGAIMHKIAGGGDNEGIYWKILHIETGKGFKISAADWGDPNLGFGDVSEFDSEGVTVSDNGGNMSVAENNMYMVVLDLRNDTKKVSVTPAEVYGIGSAFGAKDWSEDDASAKFTIDLTNKALVSPALTGDGATRMYANHAWIPAWWNAEFNVFSGAIEYRNDSAADQDPVNGTTGQVVTLTFDNNTGKIE